MEVVGLLGVSVACLLAVLWRFVQVAQVAGRRYADWFGLYFGLWLLLACVGGISLLVFDLIALLTVIRWQPLRDTVPDLPAWPRVPLMCGPRARRKRRITEPMPWQRGPLTY